MRRLQSVLLAVICSFVVPHYSLAQEGLPQLPETGLAVPYSSSVQELDEAVRLNQQAFELYQLGSYAEAKPLFKRSLAIREKALGLEHPDVAQSLNSLAELYRAQGRYADAEALFKRSLVILKKASGTRITYWGMQGEAFTHWTITCPRIPSATAIGDPLVTRSFSGFSSWGFG